MRTLLIAALCMGPLAACAQPAPDQPPPGAPGYAQQGWSGGMQGAGGATQAPSPGYGAPPPGYGGAPDAGGPPAPPPVPPMAEEGGRGGHEKMAEKFAAANVTHDGRLTQEQAQAGGMKGIARHFAQIDRDQKGYVTLQDIKAWKHERKAEKQARAAQPTAPAAGSPGYPPPAPASGYPPAGPAGQQY